jgi:protein transport protein SEC13
VIRKRSTNHLTNICRDLNGSPEIETTLNAHSDWVRDVAWAPNIGLPGEYIATCGQVSPSGCDFSFLPESVADGWLALAYPAQDRTVQIHFRPSPTSAWTSTKLLPHGSDNPDPLFPDAVWRVSWSLAGNVLAVACADGKVTLWKEVIGGKGWECVNEMSG